MKHKAKRHRKDNHKEKRISKKSDEVGLKMDEKEE